MVQVDGAPSVTGIYIYIYILIFMSICQCCSYTSNVGTLQIIHESSHEVTLTYIWHQLSSSVLLVHTLQLEECR